MTRTDEDLVRQAYEAFNNRDSDAAVDLMDPDVEWPNVATGTFVHGHDEVRDHWRQQFAEVDPRIEMESVSRRDDGKMEVTVRQIVLGLDGAELSDDRLIHVFAVEGGLITRMEIETLP